MNSDARVQVWTVTLDGDEGGTSGVLSPDELERASRFRFEFHRRRYVAARSALRRVLGSCMDSDPASLSFRYSPNGKPFLDETPLRFNVSHSGGYALIAVARDRELGVDLEEIRDRTDLVELAGRYFAPSERAAVEGAPAEVRADVFYRIWTRKEAYLKARGDGLTLPLDSFSVSAAAVGEAMLCSSAEGPSELARWQYVEIPSPAGFASALVIERGPVELKTQVWGG